MQAGIWRNEHQDNGSLDYVYSTWLPRSGRSLAQPWIVEIYATAPTADAAQAEIEVWVPIR